MDLGGRTVLLFAVLIGAAYGGCKQDNWIEDTCEKHQTCDPDDFGDHFDSIEHCIEVAEAQWAAWEEMGPGCPEAARSDSVCYVQQLCGEVDNCDATHEAAIEMCN